MKSIREIFYFFPYTKSLKSGMYLHSTEQVLSTLGSAGVDNPSKSVPGPKCYPTSVLSHRALGHSEFPATEQETSRFSQSPGSAVDRVKMQILGLHPPKIKKKKKPLLLFLKK